MEFLLWWMLALLIVVALAVGNLIVTLGGWANIKRLGMLQTELFGGKAIAPDHVVRRAVFLIAGEPSCGLKTELLHDTELRKALVDAGYLTSSRMVPSFDQALSVGPIGQKVNEHLPLFTYQRGTVEQQLNMLFALAKELGYEFKYTPEHHEPPVHVEAKREFVKVKKVKS